MSPLIDLNAFRKGLIQDFRLIKFLLVIKSKKKNSKLTIINIAHAQNHKARSCMEWLNSICFHAFGSTQIYATLLYEYLLHNINYPIPISHQVLHFTSNEAIEPEKACREPDPWEVNMEPEYLIVLQWYEIEWLQ